MLPQLLDVRLQLRLLYRDLFLPLLVLPAKGFLFTLNRVDSLLLAQMLILVVLLELHLASVRFFDFPADLFFLLPLALAHFLNFVAILFLLGIGDRIFVLQE